MKNIFQNFTSSQFAVLTIAAILGSGYGAVSFAAPIARPLIQLTGISRQLDQVAGLITPSVSSISSALNTLSGDTKTVVANAVSSPSSQSDLVTSFKSQVASLTSRIAQLENKRAEQPRNVVLGDSTSTEPAPARSEFPAATNLLRNSSFEESSDGAPRQWRYQYDSTSGNTFTTVEAIRTGAQGLKFVGGGTGNFGISQPSAKAVERRNYAFSVWVKPVNTDAHTIKLSFWDEVNNKEAKSKTFNLSGTKEWSRLVFQIENKDTWNGKNWFPMITVNGLGSGALYIDDAQLEEASSYTSYHFVGGGALQSHVSILGDGSVEIDSHGNIYPAVDGIGALGTGGSKFQELKLSKASINKDGDLDLSGGLTVNGNSTLKGTVSFTARFSGDLLPDTDNTYNIGSSTYRWKSITTGTGTNSFGGATNIGDGGTTNYLQVNATGDLQLFGTANNIVASNDLVVRSGLSLTLDTSTGAGVLAVRTGTGQLALTSGGTTTSAIALAATNGGIDLSTSGLAGNGNLTLRSAGGLVLDTTANNTTIDILAGNSIANSLTLRSFNGGIDLSSSAANGSGDIKIRASGTLSLDTSAKNANILANTGTGRFIVTSNAIGTGTTAGISLLTTNGGIDLSTSGLAGNGNLTLRSGGNLLLDASGNSTNIDILAGNSIANSLTLRSFNGGIDLSSSSASGSGDIKVRSAGTLSLDTSANNTNILANTGKGRLIVTSNATGTGTTAGISLLATNGGIDISTSGVGGNGNLTLRSGGNLLLDASGNRNSIDILAGAITSTSLTLKSANGGIDISSGYASGSGDIIVRSGGSVRIDTSGSGSADTKSNNIILSSGGRGGGATGSAIMLQANNGAINLSTGNAAGSGDIALRAGGSLVFDTSSKNGDINVFTGTGNFQINQTAAVASSFTFDVSGTGRFTCANNFTNTSKATYCSDVAETYETNGVLEAGDVLTVDPQAPTKVAKSTHAYQSVLGVFSTSPGLLVGGETVLGNARIMGDNKVPVAMVGRVPVKVTNEGGAIKIGDRLVSATKPGYAMKATREGLTLGIALDSIDFADGNGEGTLMTYVNISWYHPEVAAALEKEYAVANVLGTAVDTTAALAALPADATTTSSPTTVSPILGAETSSLATITPVTPPTKFANVEVGQALSVGGSLTVAGTSRFEGDVTVIADATFQEGVVVVGNVRIGGDLEVAGAVTTNFTAGASVAAGDPIAVTSTGTVSRASNGRAVIGIAVSNTDAGETVKVAVAGKVGGLTGLTAGSRYFVSDGGVLTTDGKGAQAVGVAVSTTEMLVQPGVGLPGEVQPSVIPTSVPTSTPTEAPAPILTPVPTVTPIVTPAVVPTLVPEPTTTLVQPTPTPAAP